MAKSTESPMVEINAVSKSFGDVRAVDGVDAVIREGEFFSLLGPSGCGKTTLLNAIAGFHSITEGSIEVDGELLCGPTKPKAEQGADRMVVFQHGALFPWKTLQENVAYGPTVQKAMSSGEAMDKAGQMLAEAGLGSFIKKFPGEVSSGMARRAEIVRALINNPKVLLLDEPYRAMDALTKQIMHESLLETYDRTGVTIFFITHDLEEAIFLGDKVHIVTTRPCQLKKTVEVNIPRPRSYETQSSEEFRKLLDEVNEAVHEEAVKAFKAGERELA